MKLGGCHNGLQGHLLEFRKQMGGEEVIITTRIGGNRSLSFCDMDHTVELHMAEIKLRKIREIRHCEISN